MNVKIIPNILLNRIVFSIVFKKNKISNNLIFLLGHDRSGSSWIGSMLGLAKNTIYLHEPINETASNIGNWALYHSYLDAGECSEPHEKIYDVATRGIGVRNLRISECVSLLTCKPTVVIKETGGMLLGNWLQNRYGGKIIALFRHPAPLILSNIKMSSDNADMWLKRLMEQDEIASMPEIKKGLSKINTKSVIEKFAAVYCIRYTILLRQLEQNPDWIQIFYEDFCLNPEQEFEKLFQKVGLKFSEKIRRRILDTTTRDESGKFFGKFRISKNQVFDWRENVSHHMEKEIRTVMDVFEMPIYANDQYWYK
jgi:hypothetical protein